jgi:hypothetical protein
MTETELLADWLNDLSSGMHGAIEGMAPEALAWQPDPGANSIGVTVWHVSRWLDILGARILQDLPAEEEQWHTRGWAERTGYDPRGIGSGGLGAISGYTLEEVAAVPPMPAGDLLAYFDQACESVSAQVLGKPEGALYRPVPGLGGRRTAYQWIKVLLQGCFGHLGEIEALKAMRERAANSVL